MRTLIAAISASCLVATPYAHASGWKPVFQRGSFVATVSPAGGSPVLAYSYDMSQNPTDFMPLYSAMNAIYTPLRSKWDQIVYSYVSTLPQYRSHTSSVSGPIRFSYTTSAATSSSRVQITAPSLSFTVHLHDSAYGIGVDCTASISSGPITITAADYISASGVLVTPAVSITPTKNVGCSTSLSWVPILGDLLDHVVNSRADAGVQGAIDKFQSDLQQQLPTSQFFSLPSIPRGKFVLNGTDYGAYIADNLPYLLTSGGFQLFVNDPAWSEPAKVGIVTTDRLAITFSGANSGLSFDLREDAKYLRTWVCDPGVPCQQP